MILDNLKNAWNKLTSSIYSITYDGKPVLSFDSIKECGVDATAEVMTYPTETGIKITDYKYPNPTEISIQGVISNSSILLNKIANQTDLITNKQDLITSTTETLNVLKDKMYIVNIQTKHKLYEQYVLKKFHIDENKDNFGLFTVDMDFMEFITVKNVDENFKNATDKNTVDNGISKVRSL